MHNRRTVEFRELLQQSETAFLVLRIHIAMNIKSHKVTSISGVAETRECYGIRTEKF